jgi:hypothetical protein
MHLLLPGDGARTLTEQGRALGRRSPTAAVLDAVTYAGICKWCLSATASAKGSGRMLCGPADFAAGPICRGSV